VTPKFNAPPPKVLPPLSMQPLPKLSMKSESLGGFDDINITETEVLEDDQVEE